MPLQATSGAASQDGFGGFGGAAAVPQYIEDVFSTYLYTGNGTTQTITNGIDLSTKGGLVWLKRRDSASVHMLWDTNRGAIKYLASNTTNAEVDFNSGNPSVSYNSTGFGLVTAGFAMNASGGTYASWTLRKQPKFFDIVTWTHTGTNGRVINHSLGSTPGMIIVKNVTSGGSWPVWHRSAGTGQSGIYLQKTDAFSATDEIASVNSTSFTLSNSFDCNGDTGATGIAYVFAHNAGGFGLTGTDNVISCGSYTTSTAAVTLGWEPQWILIKNITNGSYGTPRFDNWDMVDNMRGMNAGSDPPVIYANTSGVEEDAGGIATVNPTGFTGVTANSDTWIYVAIRRGPMKVPTDATTVFKPLTRNGTGAAASVTTVGFAPDMAMINIRGSGGRGFVDKLRGPRLSLTPSNTGVELTSPTTKDVKSFNQNGISFAGGSDQFSSNSSGQSYVNWYIKRSPSVFDIVCYNGTGSNTTFTHNLGVVPELMIVRRRETGDDWNIYSSALANTEYLVLNSTAAKATGATRWNSTTPTSSVFSVGTSTTTNASAGTYVAYLFATCSGVSKVGSYTGNGSTQTINCGFGAGGARFVLIKRTDSTGDWYAYDTARGMTVLTDPYIPLNLDSANDEVATLGSVTTVSTGFALDSTILAAINVNTGTYIFLAFA